MMAACTRLQHWFQNWGSHIILLLLEHNGSKPCPSNHLAWGVKISFCVWLQLLETGLLHADPHPGNLLRTPSGKVCILDFGLMVRLLLSFALHATPRCEDTCTCNQLLLAANCLKTC